MDIEYINKFTDNIVSKYNSYYVIIDGEIALLNDALRLGYPTKEMCLKAFALKINWWIKCRLDNKDPDYHFATSRYIKRMQNLGRLEVLTLNEYKEKIKNGEY